MQKRLRIINYTIIKIFNILIGVPLVFAVTLVILSICLVDLILLLLPVFFICNIFFQYIVVIVSQNNLGIQFIFTIIGTVMGYYLQRILKIYVPKWFKEVGMYINKSFTFYY
ncbi:hypothetical protein [Clostridium weizhouense]|uniref:Uncharacterized protein n=1 Tax=Clostridium weizhouense TaxID=2859781 RepID=A0ABS7ARN7_9CLOT|nr:hypothetical protein [Clostridium weizhouense]MBW6411347.1 hypothetical protein [Clostridium weizhouense]